MRGIRCANLTFRYTQTGKYPVLEHADLKIEPGSVTVLTGPSGCGKSTLLYLLAGIYPQNAGVVDEGEVWVDDGEIGALPPSSRAPLAGMVFQNPDLQFCMDTVENELIFCLENLAIPPEEMDERIEKALAFCGIGTLRKRSFATLSGGEKQKAMLACAALIRPAWLLLDEPFANIDPESTKELVQRLGAMHREYGISIVAVDHRLEPWLPILDEAVLVGSGARVTARNITRDNLPEWRETFEQEGIAFPGQRYCPGKKRRAPQGEAALALRGVSAGYGEAEVLRSLSAAFYPGLIYAVTGKSGSGKSTLFSVLCRTAPYRGSILLQGKELKSIRKKATARRMGFVFQNPQDQFVAGSVYEEIALSMRKTVPPEALEQRVKEYLQEIGLWRHRHLSPFMLSQGQQRRLAVAALLAYDCDVLVCDEPTYAQDLRSLLSVMKLLTERVDKQGITLIFSTHDTRLAQDYADVVYCLRDGKLEERQDA